MTAIGRPCFYAQLVPSGPTDDYAIDNTSSQYPAHERSRDEQKPGSRARHHPPPIVNGVKSPVLVD